MIQANARAARRQRMTSEFERPERVQPMNIAFACRGLSYRFDERLARRRLVGWLIPVATNLPSVRPSPASGKEVAELLC
jgi:hypothetical protein